MKLVTLFGKYGRKTVPEYIPGRCNIGFRGRTMRLATGLAIVGVFLALGILLLGSSSPFFRFFLFVPFYAGLLAILEGSMSFCVLHASRGTYDLSEPSGMAFTRSETKKMVESEEWKKVDKRKAQRMHLEAIIGAIVFAALLALA